MNSKNHLPGCICKDCRNRTDWVDVVAVKGKGKEAPVKSVFKDPAAAMASQAPDDFWPGWSDWGWDDGSWWDDSWWTGWDDPSWWGFAEPALPCGGVSDSSGPQSLPSLATPGDMKEEIQKFCDKYELVEVDREKVADSFSRCGETWAQDLRELDHALSKARNPTSLLQARLRELEAIRGFQVKAKQGHLPGCMCPACKENKFARAVGTETAVEAKSLNAAALVAYQVEQEAINGGPPPEEMPDAFSNDLKGKGKGKALILPTGDLLPEVKAFCTRFALTERLQTKVMDTLRKRGDPEWRQDLAEMNRDLSKARNPSGLLVVKLGDIQKELNPNQLCFNYRAGTCTWGDKCRWSHDVAVGAERMNSSSLLAANAKGTVASLPVKPPPEASAGAGAGAGFGGPGGFGIGGSKVDKLLRRKRPRSSSSDRGRPGGRENDNGLPPGPWPSRDRPRSSDRGRTGGREGDSDLPPGPWPSRDAPRARSPPRGNNGGARSPRRSPRRSPIRDEVPDEVLGERTTARSDGGEDEAGTEPPCRSASEGPSIASQRRLRRGGFRVKELLVWNPNRERFRQIPTSSRN